MNILLHTPSNAFWTEQAEKLRQGLNTSVIAAPALSDVPPETLREVSILITYGISSSELALLPKLRFLATPMAGVNTLPLKDLHAAGVVVINAHANGQWVAERALALLLAATGHIVSGDRDLRKGRWHGFAAAEPVDQSWRSISDMTIAIIGTGSIGQWTARFIRPFGSRILGIKRTPETNGIPDGLFDEIGTDLKDAFDRSDAVIVTLPSTPATVGLIDTEYLKALDGGILVNVGRGDVIDEAALFHAASTGHITAAVDTWFTYPDPPGARCYPSRFPLETLENVILSPHLGGFTPPATRFSAEEVVQRVMDWVNSGSPADFDNVVDLQAGY